MEEKRVQRVLINMTVMRSNYRQVPAFLNLARRYGFFTSFAPIRGSFGDENIFDPQDPATLKELRDILHAQDLTMGDTNLAQFAAQVDHL
jgi:MoaA/NifB/PqqE/SkfB family radical SAM enzyme